MDTLTCTLPELLNISTGIFCSEDFDDVYKVLDFMTNDSLSTLQLPRASDECKPYLLMQFPWLAEIHKEDIIVDHNVDQMRVNLEHLKAKYGNSFELQRMAPDDHEVIDPISELLRMRPDAKIVTFDPETGDADEL